MLGNATGAVLVFNWDVMGQGGGAILVSSPKKAPAADLIIW